MNRESLINFLKVNRTIIKSYGMTYLALFGSFARDEAKATSDLELFQNQVLRPLLKYQHNIIIQLTKLQ
jgi:predicted nucleotidyltransferase